MVEFARATRPLTRILEGLSAGFEKYGIDEELRRYLRDVADHATLVTQQQNEEMKQLAQAGHAQNEEIKKISSWAAILFAPTLVGTKYGMNFDHMPELGWVLGYPFALALMALVCGGLYVIFKRRDWLQPREGDLLCGRSFRNCSSPRCRDRGLDRVHHTLVYLDK